MAKATLEYDLNDIDDVYSHKRAIKSLDMALALWELTHNTKKGIGYTLEGYDIKGQEISNYEVVEMVFEKIYQILSDHNIDLEDLME